MRRLVINLERDAGRLAWMSAAFETMGLCMEPVRAVDRHDLGDDLVRRSLKPGLTGLGRGEIACFLSHLNAWKLAADGPDDFVAFFEDDVHFSSNAATFLGDSSWIPAGVDVVKLETTLQTVVTGREKPAPGSHRLGLLHTYHFASGGYILSRRCARRLVASARRIDRPLDDFLFDGGHFMPCWQLFPAICIQDLLLPVGKVGLGSRLQNEREAQRGGDLWKSKRSPLEKTVRECRRIGRRLFVSKQRVVPFGDTVLTANFA